MKAILSGPIPTLRDTSALKNKELTLGEKVARFIESNCCVPEGDDVGKPVVLADFQKLFIQSVYDNPHQTDTAILSMARKNAKALCLDTPIPTSRGWKSMGDIRVGDYVHGTNGEAVKVVAESEIFLDKECFEVSFSDGSKIIASEDHIWKTKHKFRPWGDNGRHKYNRRPIIENVTTRQIYESIFIERGDLAIERNHSVPVPAAIEMDRCEFLIHPYVLGAWLGDGKTKGAEIFCSLADLSHMLKNLSMYESIFIKQKEGKCCTIKLTDHEQDWHAARKDSFRSRLKLLGVFGDKHIPENYFNSSLEQRWALLQGLMDTDGTVNLNGGKSPRASFSSKCPSLAHGVWRLCRSLGLKAKIIQSRAMLYNKDCGICYKVEFSVARSFTIFRMQRKQILLPELLGARSKSIQITSCVPVGKKPCKCIAVDSDDHLFLAGYGCIPTHNTGTIAFLVIAHLVGPVAIQNSRIISGAMSREQAAEVYNLASKCLMMSEKLRPLVNIVPSSKTITGIPCAVEYKAISAEGKTAHGKSPVVAILDEVGQIRGPQSDFVDAITTAQGAYKNALLIYISTQAATDADLFSLQIDDAHKSKPPKTVCHVYAAEPKASVKDEQAWKDANPALGLFRSIEDVRKQAEKADRMPSFENTFRNLILNQRVSVISPFVSRSVWEQNGGEPDSLDGLDVYGGLDLSSRTDLTSLVLSARDASGILHMHAYAWTPKEGVIDRAKRDRVPYDVWVKQGYLRTTPGHTVDYDYVASEIAEITTGLDLVAMAFDRWKITHFKKSCEHMGVNFPLIEYGQGFKDMSPALDAFEADLLNGKIRHGMHPVFTMCAGNAVVTKDPAGGRKLDKSKATGRIDCMVAAAMSEGAAIMHQTPEAPASYNMFFV